MRLMHGDCLEQLRGIEDKSVDLVLTDPPYNIKKADWDKIDRYIDWCAAWLHECARVLKDNGSLYIWHNDMPQIAQLMERIRMDGEFAFVSFCVWDKTESYRAREWKQRDPDADGSLRSWFNRCEYCLEYAKRAGTGSRDTGMERINSDPNCYRPLKDWIAAETQRLKLTKQDIAKKYTEATGRKPHMLRHYFQDSQFEIPTRAVWESVYMALGFARTYEELREQYEELREQYEELRTYHRCDEKHCNVWTRPVLQSCQKDSGHPCEKPVDLLRRIIRVSCRPGGAVLDLFMGGGSTGVAALEEGRDFIGIERDAHWFDVARRRIERERTRPRQIGMEEILRENVGGVTRGEGSALRQGTTQGMARKGHPARWRTVRGVPTVRTHGQRRHAGEGDDGSSHQAQARVSGAGV